MGITQLTSKQREVLNKITDFIRKNGQSPTVSELAKLLEVSSLRTVTQYLEILETKGFIARSRFQTRGIKVLALDPDTGPATVILPVISSVACGGLTVYAEPIFDEHITVDTSFLHGISPDKTLVVRAAGNSMVDAGVEDGDYVIIERTSDVKNGDKVIAIVNGMALLKQIVIAPNATVLKPMSPDPVHKPLVMKNNFEVFGKMLDVIKYFNTDELTYEFL